MWGYADPMLRLLREEELREEAEGWGAESEERPRLWASDRDLESPTDDPLLDEAMRWAAGMLLDGGVTAIRIST